MAIKQKKTFGAATVDHFSPEFLEDAPTSINMYVSFEEALKLQLGLQQILLRLNSYKRSTKEGRVTAVNMCIHTRDSRITINEGRIREA